MFQNIACLLCFAVTILLGCGEPTVQVQQPQVTEEPEFLSFKWNEVDRVEVESDSISTSKICFTNFNDVNSIRFAVHESSIFQMKNYGEAGNFRKRGKVMEVLKFDSVQKLFYFGYTKLDPKISDFFVFGDSLAFRTAYSDKLDELLFMHVSEIFDDTVAISHKSLVPHVADLFVEKKRIGFVIPVDTSVIFYLGSPSGRFEEIDVAGFINEMSIQTNESGQLYGVLEDTALFIENGCNWNSSMVSTSRFYVLNDEGTQFELLDVFGCALELYGSDFSTGFLVEHNRCTNLSVVYSEFGNGTRFKEREMPLWPVYVKLGNTWCFYDYLVESCGEKWLRVL